MDPRELHALHTLLTWWTLGMLMVTYLSMGEKIILGKPSRTSALWFGAVATLTVISLIAPF